MSSIQQDGNGPRSESDPTKKPPISVLDEYYAAIEKGRKSCKKLASFSLPNSVLN
jgi:hypothetical protein